MLKFSQAGCFVSGGNKKLKRPHPTLQIRKNVEEECSLKPWGSQRKGESGEPVSAIERSE